MQLLVRERSPGAASRRLAALTGRHHTAFSYARASPVPRSAPRRSRAPSQASGRLSLSMSQSHDALLLSPPEGGLPTAEADEGKALLSFDARGTVLIVNREAAALFVAKPGTLVGASVAALLGPECGALDGTAGLLACAQGLEADGAVGGRVFEAWRRGGGGGTFPVSVWVRRLPSTRHGEARFLAVLEPVERTEGCCQLGRDGAVRRADEGFGIIVGGAVDGRDGCGLLPGLQLPDGGGEAVQWVTVRRNDGGAMPVRATVQPAVPYGWRVETHAYAALAGLVVCDADGIIADFVSAPCAAPPLFGTALTPTVCRTGILRCCSSVRAPRRSPNTT